MSTHADFQIIYDQVRWVERYLHELDCISPQPTPDLNAKTHQASTATAPDFFRMLRGLLFDAAALEAAKLLDAASQSGHDNISLDALIQHADWLSGEEKDNAIGELGSIREQFPQIKHSRNKVLAHADYEAVTDLKGSAAHNNHIDPDQLSSAVVKIRILVDRIRPHGIQQAPLPRNHNEWLGVSVVLERLSRT